MQKNIRYYLAEDTIDKRDIDALIEWLKKYPRLTMGEMTKKFEEKWNRWLGRKYSIFCNSGSSANLLMYYSLLLSGRLKNRKVVVPSVGWPTTISPAIQFGFEPIMCEADKETFGLDLDHLEELVKEHDPGTVAMVQVLGVPHKMERLIQLKDKHGFFLLEDACTAMGSSYKGRKLGTFGDMASFSLYFGHQISTIEGGLVSTDDKEIYELLAMLRSHGWRKELDRDIYVHENSTDSDIIKYIYSSFVFYEPGFNLRPTDLHAFLGLRQIDKMEWLIERRTTNHKLYQRKLRKYFYAQQFGSESVSCSIHFGILAKDMEQRDDIFANLVKNGVETRIFSAGNLGLHPFWTNRYGESSFPMADRIHHCGLFLPNNPSLNSCDIDFISSTVLEGAGIKSEIR